MKKIKKGCYEYKGYEIIKFKIYDNFVKMIHEGWRIVELHESGRIPTVATNKLYQAKEQIDSWGEK
tara:strand:- start:837 stop:1034 length:198 start_codon:yes stop_codon:yes gene_type:complete